MAFNIGKKSWRYHEKLTGKIFREKRVRIPMQGQYRVYKMVYRGVSAPITLDDSNTVDWLVYDSPTVEPAAIMVKPIFRQTHNMKTYRREDCKVGCGQGRNHSKHAHVFGIDMESESLGWKGREYYTDEEFLAWNKGVTKLKELTRTDFNLYVKIKKAQRELFPVPN
tara:strand:- start:70 stop:570 length:501 start_codon:yes stop_codon:yes gene_type:complete